MNIDPGFVDHWQLKALKKLTNRAEAAEYLIRLWGACQTRKSQQFSSSALDIAALCCYEGEADAETFCSWLIDSQWLEKREGGYWVVNWEKWNRKLISAWENGFFGGGRKNRSRPGSVTDQGVDGQPIRTSNISKCNITKENTIEYRCAQGGAGGSAQLAASPPTKAPQSVPKPKPKPSLPVLPPSNGSSAHKAGGERFFSRDEVQAYLEKKNFHHAGFPDLVWGKIRTGKYYGVLIENWDDLKGVIAEIGEKFKP